ncbi:MAG TPA: IclR family transcriptional regulator [Dongiaceae bacterium]|jgi:IclR family transcriptional regulator, KDG regulon repressor
MTQAGKARLRANNAQLPGPPEEEQGGSRSVRRALEMFEFLLQRGEPATVGTIVSALQIPKSTAYELVRTLSEAGYLEPAGRTAGLFLGRKLFELGMAYRGQVDLLRDGSQIVEELRDASGETVQLSVLENDMMLVLLKEEGSRSIRIISRVGSRVPVNWAAAGRLLVSDLDDGALGALLKRSVRQSPTGRATTEVSRLIQQIRKFRKQGYATELNETNEHAGCVAAPVIDGSGRCIAAISVVAPEHRLGKQNRDTLIEKVRDAAAKLSSRLGAH